jgi:hypothetical protein
LIPLAEFSLLLRRQPLPPLQGLPLAADLAALTLRARRADADSQRDDSVMAMIGPFCRSACGRVMAVQDRET